MRIMYKYMVSESTEEYQKDLLNILNISVDLDNLENLTNRITEIYHEVNDEDFIELYKNVEIIQFYMIAMMKCVFFFYLDMIHYLQCINYYLTTKSIRK